MFVTAGDEGMFPSPESRTLLHLRPRVPTLVRYRDELLAPDAILQYGGFNSSPLLGDLQSGDVSPDICNPDAHSCVDRPRAVVKARTLHASCIPVPVRFATAAHGQWYNHK